MDIPKTEVDFILECMLNSISSYTEFTEILKDCRIIRIVAVSLPPGKARVGIRRFHGWYFDDNYGAYEVELSKNDLIEEQAKSFGHELGHICLDYLRLAKEPHDIWPTIRNLTHKVNWTQNEEDICEIFAEKWLGLVKFKPTLIHFLEYLQDTDEFFLLL